MAGVGWWRGAWRGRAVRGRAGGAGTREGLALPADAAGIGLCVDCDGRRSTAERTQ